MYPPADCAPSRSPHCPTARREGERRALAPCAPGGGGGRPRHRRRRPAPPAAGDQQLDGDGDRSGRSRPRTPRRARYQPGGALHVPYARAKSSTRDDRWRAGHASCPSGCARAPPSATPTRPPCSATPSRPPSPRRGTAPTRAARCRTRTRSSLRSRCSAGPGARERRGAEASSTHTSPRRRSRCPRLLASSRVRGVQRTRSCGVRGGVVHSCIYKPKAKAETSEYEFAQIFLACVAPSEIAALQAARLNFLSAIWAKKSGAKFLKGDFCVILSRNKWLQISYCTYILQLQHLLYQ